MIQELYIENFAIIEKTHVNFTKGLNVLTGETGAGKSIILDAIELILGSRADKGLIGSYGDRALVETSFLIGEEYQSRILKKYGIDCKDGFIVTREIYRDENSLARINSRRVNLSVLEEIMLDLVNIHGQNENYILNDKRNYLRIIDSFDKSLGLLREELKSLLDDKKNLSEELEKLNINQDELLRQVDVLSYQIKEIEGAKLDDIDEEALLDEYKELTNAQDIIRLVGKTEDLLKGGSFEAKGSLALIEEAIFNLSKVRDYSKTIDSIAENLEDVFYNLESLSQDLSFYLSSINLDEARIQIIDERFKLIEEFKRKYGSSIDEIIAYYEKAKIDLEKLRNKDQLIYDYKKEIKALDAKILEIARKLRQRRQEIGIGLSKKILKELKDLNLENASFEITFEEKANIDKTGMDKVDFLVSFNLGQAPKPISKVASGGEISRFMLALKIVLADHDDISTLIFDEIDSGISGVTAARVGSALKDLSNNYQIILVSHLPQIALKAYNHILIDKYIENGKTKTRLEIIEDNKRVEEIARLIGGDTISEKTLDTARDLLEKEK